MPSSAEIARRNQAIQDSNSPRTEYILRLAPSQYSSTTAPPSSSGGGGGGRVRQRIARTSGALGNAATQTTVPKGVPQFLGNQRTITYAWFAAMGVIVVDEWKNNHIIARPARLWWASVFYGLLALGGMITSLIPLMNALAIGYLFVLLWQWYNGEGQFK